MEKQVFRTVRRTNLEVLVGSILFKRIVRFTFLLIGDKVTDDSHVHRRCVVSIIRS